MLVKEGRSFANSQGIIIHHRTPTFLDIEAPIDQVWVGCTDDAPADASSLMVFYVVIDGKESHQFNYRRMDDAEFCLAQREKEYLNILKGAKTVRLVGSHPNAIKIGPRKPLGKRIPTRFTATPQITPWTFQRMQANGKCKAYFDNYCDLPEKYWADTIPPKQK